MKYAEKIVYPVTSILNWILPTKRYPIVAFMGLVIFFFVLSDFIIDVAEDFASYT